MNNYLNILSQYFKFLKLTYMCYTILFLFFEAAKLLESQRRQKNQQKPEKTQAPKQHLQGSTRSNKQDTAKTKIEKKTAATAKQKAKPGDTQTLLLGFENCSNSQTVDRSKTRKWLDPKRTKPENRGQRRKLQSQTNRDRPILIYSHNLWNVIPFFFDIDVGSISSLYLLKFFFYVSISILIVDVLGSKIWRSFL